MLPRIYHQGNTKHPYEQPVLLLRQRNSPAPCRGSSNSHFSCRGSMENQRRYPCPMYRRCPGGWYTPWVYCGEGPHGAKVPTRQHNPSFFLPRQQGSKCVAVQVQCTAGVLEGVMPLGYIEGKQGMVPRCCRGSDLHAAAALRQPRRL